MDHRLRQLRKRVVQWFWFTPDRLPDKWMDRSPEWCWEVFRWTQRHTARLMCFIVGSHESTCDCGNPKHAYCLWCEQAMDLSREVSGG